MSGQLGELVISLAADTARFRSDLGKATKATQDASKEMSAHFDKMGSAVKSTIGMMAGLAGVASLGSLVKGSIDAADNMSKMSQKVGVAIDQLSGMAYAASLADVSTEQLGKGMGKLAKLMYEAAGNSSGGAAETFKTLGISVTDAAGKIRDTDAVMMDVADRLAGMDDGAAKTALAMEVFGKAGADLIPLLNGGKKGVQEAADEARRFGLILTEEAGKQAEEFNDNLTRLSSRASGVAITIANSLLPEINKLVDTFAKGGDIGKSPFMLGINSIKAEFIRVAMLADKAGGSLTAVGMLLYGPGSMAGYKPSEERFKRMADLNIMFGERYKESEKAMQALANIEVGLDSDGNPIKPTAAKGKGSGIGSTGKPKTATAANPAYQMASDVYQLVIQDAEKRYQEQSDIYQLFIQDEFNAIKSAEDKKTKLYQEQSDIHQLILQDEANAAAKAKSTKQQYMDIMEAGNPLLQLENIRSEQIALIATWDEKEIGMAEKKAAALAKIQKDYTEEKKKLDEGQWQAATSIIGGNLATVGDMLMKGNKEQFEAGKKFAIASAMINTYMAASSAFAAGAKINVVLGVASAAVAIGAGMMQVANIQSQQYQARALGGPVAGGTSYLVGEKGPEIFTPGASGQITSNDKLSKLGGGESINTTHVWQISTGVADTVRAEIARLMPMIESRTVGAVHLAINSGGSMSAAVGRM